MAEYHGGYLSPQAAGELQAEVERLESIRVKVYAMADTGLASENSWRDALLYIKQMASPERSNHEH